MPKNVNRLLQEFVDRTKEIYNEGLASITLYGSAASGEFSSGHSNINLAVVLNDASLSNLEKIAPLLNKNKSRLFNVLFFTEDYIKSSADVFPIEFLDIKENHKIIYGKDIFIDLPIDIGNLRFQCEQELKSKIINIKKIYLANINNPGLDRLLMRFFTSSLHILRNILRLKNSQAVYRKEDILQSLAAEFHVDISNMSKILEAKKTSRRLSRKIAAGLFNSFVNDLEKIAGVVDGL
jgi:predicted nucleotidyltransferase